MYIFPWHAHAYAELSLVSRRRRTIIKTLIVFWGDLEQKKDLVSSYNPNLNTRLRSCC